MVQYCYKVKFDFIKVDAKNAYKRTKLEKLNLGFEPMIEGEQGEKWFEGWAKSITLPDNCSISTWINKKMEEIYKAESKKEDSTWIKTAQEQGCEFDPEGKLLKGQDTNINAQLCVMCTGLYKGCLFINLGGAAEFYDVNTLNECVKEDIDALLAAGAIYEKRL